MDRYIIRYVFFFWQICICSRRIDCNLQNVNPKDHLFWDWGECVPPAQRLDLVQRLKLCSDIRFSFGCHLIYVHNRGNLQLDFFSLPLGNLFIFLLDNPVQFIVLDSQNLHLVVKFRGAEWRAEAYCRQMRYCYYYKYHRTSAEPKRKAACFPGRTGAAAE